jgi:DNA polymerase-1
MKIIEGIPPELGEEWVALDIELFNAEEVKLHRPHTGEFACLSICYEPDTVYLITDEKQVEEALGKLWNCIWVFHNTKFDLTHLRRWADIPQRKKLWDTMLIERIMYGGYYDFFALEDLARRYLDLKMNKDTRKSFEKHPEPSMTDGEKHYAALDASVTLQVCQAQRKVINKQEWEGWKEIENPALWAVMDFKGFRIDVQRWKELAVAHKKMADEIEADLPVNPRSYKKVKEELRRLGFSGLPGTGEGELQKYIKKYPDTEAASVAQRVLEARKYYTRFSKYGDKFVDVYLEQEAEGVDVVVTDYHLIGAKTARMSSSDPPIQNIPIKDTPIFRGCFIARPEHYLVVNDYSQQELRITAYLSQDKELLRILNQGEVDPFILMAKMTFDKDIEKSDPLRGDVKNLMYGLIYGLSERRFAEETGYELEESKEIMRKIFALFPNLEVWIDTQKKEKRYVKTVSGRKFWLNPYSEKSERNAINSPVQGTAAEMMKMAIGNIHRLWPHHKLDFSVVGVVHDELILDVPEELAQRTGDFCARIMTKVSERTCPGVIFPVDINIGENWAVKG